MDAHYDRLGLVMYACSHAMMSDRSYKSILKHCSYRAGKYSDVCRLALNYFISNEWSDINAYSIYSPTCIPQTNQTKLLHRRLLAEDNDPYIESYAEIYYNRHDVQTAMHANVTSILISGPLAMAVFEWVEWDYSVLPVYKELINTGLRIWLFSGDTDAMVPVTGPQLNLPVKTRWYAWYSGNQVGGWTEVYEGLTFATVREAGHEVPVLQPERALNL